MEFSTIHKAYLAALRAVLYHPQYTVSPRGKKVCEILDYSFVVTKPSAEPLVTFDEERNKTLADYFAKENELYNSCTNKVADFEAASKFWKQLANPDGTVNSAYGYLIWYKKSQGNKQFESFFRTPWEWVKESLISDPDSRQAVLQVALPEHRWKGNKDQVCTLHGNFVIRDKKLHLSVVMRSNDLVKGLAYDLPWFCSLLDRMVTELKPHYPDLEKGDYRHMAHSLHIYEKDLEVVKKMLGES